MGFPMLRGALGCGFCIASMALLIVSIPFFLEAAPDLELATALSNYETAFEQFEHPCEVLSVRRCWRSTPDGLEPSKATRDPEGTPHCWYAYRARFTPGAANDDESQYYSWPEYVLNGTGACHGGDDACSDEEIDFGRSPSGHLESGTSMPCWRPTGYTVDPRFLCGNRQCCARRTHRLGKGKQLGCPSHG